MSLQEFRRRGGTHLAGDNTFKILLYRQFVDGHNLVGLNHQAKGATEGLLLLSLPVEANTDGHIVQGERRLLVLWLEAQLTIVLTTP